MLYHFYSSESVVVPVFQLNDPMIIERTELKGASSLTLKFKTTSQRYYFFVMQAKHREIIKDAVCKMIMSPWDRHFCIL